METFGDRLRRERETRGLTVDGVAAAIGADGERLRALERNELDALPEAGMRDLLRAYADCLEVEADLMIEDYLREREACLRKLAGTIPDRTLAVPAVDSTRGRRRAPVLVVATSLAAAAVLTILGVWVFRSTPPELPAIAPPSSTEPRYVAPRTRPLPAAPEPAPAATEPAPAVTPPASGTTIPEHGVGTGVVHRQLVGQGDRFAEGARVWFWTRVEGGTAGETIDHVWMHDGVEVARVPLKVGGARWRTQSNKTLRRDSSGAWAVEARDASGRVLARDEFVCRP